MNCAAHPAEPVVGTCATCGSFVCRLDSLASGDDLRCFACGGPPAAARAAASAPGVAPEDRLQAERRTCQRCGNFLSGDPATHGVRVCDDCVTRLCTRRGSGSSGSTFGALIGGALGLVASIALVVITGELALAQFVLYSIGGGAFVGILFGLPFDVRQNRREREGYAGAAWAAALARVDGTGTPEVGWVFLGSRCLLFATRDGTRWLIPEGSYRPGPGKRSATQLSLDVQLPDGFEARLAVMGKEVGALHDALA